MFGAFRLLDTSIRYSRRLPLIAVMLCLVAPAGASAGTLTSWTGGGGNGSWSVISNWNPTGNAPTASGTYSLVFGGTTQTTGTNNIVGTVSIDSMQFTNAGGTGQDQFFTISGGTLAFNSASITTSSASGSPFISNSDGDTISSAMTLSGTTTVTTGALHNLSLSGGISGNGSLVFDDLSPGTTEYVYLSGSNSYSGGTQIRGGFVQTGARNPVSSSNNNAFGGGSVTISGNGTLLVRNNSVITNTLTVSGSGSSGNSMTGSFGVASGTAEYAGAITLAGDTRFNSSSAAAGDVTSRFLISGAIDLGSNQLTLRSQPAAGSPAGTAGVIIQITGRISGSGGINIVSSTATGRVLLSGSNTYSGGTTITTGTLTVGNGSALGTGFLAVNTDGLDLNGQALTVGALSGSSSGVIQSMVAGAASLTTTAATDSTYNGTIINGNGSAVVGLTKAGVGALTLTNSNSYTGPTTVNGGNLVVDNQFAIGSSGTVKFGGGTLKYTSNNQVDYSSRIKTSGSAISIDTNGQNVTFTRVIESSNTGGLTKRGAGTLFVNGVNTYTGNTVVEAGTLGGNGTIAGTVTVGTNAFISPGSTAGAIGTLSVGALELQSGATASMQISGTAAGLYDQITAVTNVTYGNALTGGALAIDFTTITGFANFNVWQLFSGTSHSGHLSSVSATGFGGLTFNYVGSGEWKATGGWLAADQSMSFYEDNTHAIGGRYQAGQLVLVPEPSAFALMGIGVAVFGWRSVNRRRGMAERLRAASADDQAAV